MGREGGGGTFGDMGREEEELLVIWGGREEEGTFGYGEVGGREWQLQLSHNCKVLGREEGLG